MLFVTTTIVVMSTVRRKASKNMDANTMLKYVIMSATAKVDDSILNFFINIYSTIVPSDGS